MTESAAGKERRKLTYKRASLLFDKNDYLATQGGQDLIMSHISKHIRNKTVEEWLSSFDLIEATIYPEEGKLVFVFLTADGKRVDEFPLKILNSEVLDEMMEKYEHEVKEA